MQVAVLASQRSPHQLAHQSAMLDGLKAIGIDAVPSLGAAPGIMHVACWGWREGKALRARGFEVLVMERGYLGDRFKWTSLGWNGLNGHATFPDVPASPDRFDALATLKPWKSGGDYTLILGQVPGDASLQGRDLMPLYFEWAAVAAHAYGLPVHFRAHPKAIEKGHRQNPKGTIQSGGTLDEALAGASMAICFNSNSAVDAVLAGVPTLTMDNGSMAWDVTTHKIGDIARPDRRDWANRLAWKQWTLEEIASGQALKPLFEMDMAHG